MPRKAREQRDDDVRDFSTIDLEALIRFHVYVDMAQHSRVPLSFRAFMGAYDHRKMIRTIDSLESQAEQLMIARSILDENNRKTGEYTDSYEEVQKVAAEGRRTKREAGAITTYGRAWAAVGGHLNELVELMIRGGDHPPFLHDVIDEQRALLTDKIRVLEASRRRSTGET